MAALNQQFAASSTHKTSTLNGRVDSDGAIVAANHDAVGNASKRFRCYNSTPGKSVNKIINTRNAITALFIMLILLLTLQAQVCCDGVITSQLTLPPAEQQPSRPAQIPPQSVKITAARPVTAQAKAVKVIPAKAVAAAKTELRLAAIAPASGPKQAINVAEDGIKTDAAATLISVAGSGLVKIADTGDALDDIASQWECVEDRSNNLTWEVKKNDGGIRDRDHSYSWFNRIGTNMPDGASNGGRCNGGVSCDTSSYIQAMNQNKLCGYSDWRLPTREELETLVEFNNDPAQATINRKYFPQAIPSWYWTASENPDREGYAWYVLFRNGIALNDLKERPKHIRLVRGNIKQ